MCFVMLYEIANCVLGIHCRCLGIYELIECAANTTTHVTRATRFHNLYRILLRAHAAV